MNRDVYGSHPAEESGWYEAPRPSQKRHPRAVRPETATPRPVMLPAPAEAADVEDAPVSQSAPRVFVGAHPGAGVTTWALLLEGTDAGMSFPATGAVIGVCRATPAGLEQARRMVGFAGVDRFTAFLVIADAPGRTLAAGARGIKILSSVVPVVQVPWENKLRGIQTPSVVAAAMAKSVARVNTRLASATVRIPRGIRASSKEKK